MTQPSAIQRADAAACALPCLAPNADAPLEPKEPLGDTFLDPWRIARSTASQSFLAVVMRLIATRETETAYRKNVRRAADQQRWDATVEAVVCALALAVLAPPPSGRLVLPRAHSRKTVTPKRYQTPEHGTQAVDLQNHLAALNLASVEIGRKKGTATTLAPSSLFADLVREAGLNVEDFGWRKDREAVVLRETRRVAGRRERRDLAYEDTAETRAIRAEIAAFNAHLAGADISYLGDGKGVDVSARQLRRCFTVREGQGPRFDQGGRFYGGFWQQLRKGDRRYIRINGEALVELDYAAAFSHIAFALLGIEPTPGADLYRIPGLEGMGRKQIKAALNTFYFDDTARRRRWPTSFAECEWEDPVSGEVFEGIAAQFTPATVRAAIVGHYPALDQAMGKGLGLWLMFLESEIMRRLLITLREGGIVALPLHDALAVPLSNADAVHVLMIDAATAVLGRHIPITTPAAASITTTSLLH